MRNDVIKMYKEIHSWVGIISGLALFIAFYAGALTMFGDSLQRWASPPSQFESLTPLANTQELLEKVQEQYPEASQSYQIILKPGPEQPARMNWNSTVIGDDGNDLVLVHYANLTTKGKLEVSTQAPSEVARLVDNLHRQVGLPFSHEVSMPIMGVISFLYFLALVSGVFVLIPTLIKDLFAFRVGKNLKRMWLDMHNVLGLFSLPFHIIMALTAIVFAFHDQLYDAQEILLTQSEQENTPTVIEESSLGPVVSQVALSPNEIVDRLAEQAPDFELTELNYSSNPRTGLALRVFGADPRYGMRSPEGGLALIDPYTGEIIGKDYLPGHQDALAATLTSFFTLHFGSYGGNTIRWSYFFLGLAGACLFYTGNLLWIEMRRKKQRRANKGAAIVQTKSARVLGALTIGISLGCVAGISLSIAAAKVLPLWVDNSEFWHEVIYYAVFLAAIAWAFKRGVAKGAVDLLVCAAVLTLMIPFSSVLSLLISGLGWNHYDSSLMIDFVAIIGAGLLLFLSRKTAMRIKSAPMDSTWYAT